MQKILSVNEIKVYSRKQITNWVQSSKVSTFQQLKNGLFFFKILQKLVPCETRHYKPIQKPVSGYEQTQNLLMVKKILNKYNLQLNMNIQQIINTKNCFEIANWFRNLYEQNKNDGEPSFSEKSYTPAKMTIDECSNSGIKCLSRATSSDKKNGFGRVGEIRKIGRVTSGFIGMNKNDKLNYTLKVPQGFDSQLTYQIFSSNNRNTQKNSLSSQKLISQQLRTAKSRTKNQIPQNNWFTETLNDTTNKKSVKGFQKERTKTKQKPKTLTEQQNIANLMQIQALEEQIQGIQEIVKKVQQFMAVCEPNIGIQKLREQIIRTIYQIQDPEKEKMETSRMEAI